MKLWKRILSCFLSFAVAVTMMCGLFVVEALAANAITISPQQALDWITSDDKKDLDYECVQYVNHYIKHLCGSDIYCETPNWLVNNQYVISGYPLSLIKGVDAQQGDIIIWTGGNAGHIAIYDHDYAWYDYNSVSHHAFGAHNTYYKYLGDSYSYWGVLRPQWNTAPADTTPPVVSNQAIADTSTTSSRGFTATCLVSDNVGVTAVQLGVWNNTNTDIDHAHWYDATIYRGSPDSARVNVPLSDFGNADGTYYANFWVYDAAGNNICIPAPLSITYTTAPVVTNVSRCDISPILAQTYTGSAITPNIAVTNGPVPLTKGTDYTVSYSNNVNAGTATVTITGKGNYTGTKTTTFKISPKDAQNLSISSISNQNYTGSAITPSITVKDGSKTLSQGTDYSVSYSNNVNAGTATVTVTGKGNYSGSKITTFTIAARSASDFSISSIASQTYTGSQICPAVTVKYGSKTLVNGTDYVVSYSNNVNVGTATVTVTGRGSYSGSKNASFKITAKDIKSANIPTIADQIYTGSAIKPAITVTDGNKTLVSGTDYTSTYSNNTKSGTATVTVSGKGNYTGTKTATFKIVAKAAGNFKISSIADQTYTGSEIKPSVIVKDGNTTLTKGTDYSVSYYNNTYVGSATAIVTGKGDYSGVSTVDFKIVPKNIKNTSILEIPDQTYTGRQVTPLVTVSDGRITLGENYDYTVSYSNNTNKGTAKVTVKGIGNYTGTVTTSFKIVADKEISDISAIFLPNKTTYNLNEKLDLTGGVILVVYSNGTSNEISMTDRNISSSGFDSSREGSCTVTLKYNGKSVKFVVSIIDNGVSDSDEDNDNDYAYDNIDDPDYSTDDDDAVLDDNYSYDSSKAISVYSLSISGSIEANDLNNAFRRIDTLKDKNAVYSISINEDIDIDSISFPKYAKQIYFMPSNGVIRTSATRLEPKTDLEINTKIVNSSGKSFDIIMPANTTITIGNSANIKIKNLKGTSSTSLFVRKSIEVNNLTDFKKVVTYSSYMDNVSGVFEETDVILTITGKATGIKYLSGILKIKGYGSNHPVKITNVATAEILLTKGSNNTVAPVTIKNITGGLSVTVINSKGKKVALKSGLCVAKTNGDNDISSMIHVLNKDKSGKMLVAAQSNRKIYATNDYSIGYDTSLLNTDQEDNVFISTLDGFSAYAPNLKSAFNIIEKQKWKCEYSIELIKDLNEDNIVFPKNAISLFITGNGKLTTSATTLKPNCSLFIDTAIVNKNNKAISISMPSDTALTVGVNSKILLGTVTGNKTATLTVYKDTTVNNIKLFKKVEVSDIATLYVKEKMSNIGALSGNIKMK